jgi:hypothetical protein
VASGKFPVLLLVFALTVPASPCARPLVTTPVVGLNTRHRVQLSGDPGLS